MSDPLEETISLSDMTEITETQGPRATQQLVRSASQSTTYIQVQPTLNPALL